MPGAGKRGGMAALHCGKKPGSLVGVGGDKIKKKKQRPANESPMKGPRKSVGNKLTRL